MINEPELASTRRPRRSAVQTRDHILDVAENLFYWRGIHATGIDAIVAAAEIAPTTLYRQFRSKDDLVAAYVDRYAAGYRAWIETITTAPGRPARDRILALFEALASSTGPGEFRGCPFLMTLAEYPDADSAAHASAQAVKAWVRARIGELTLELAGPARGVDPRVLADQLALIVEGVYASTAALGPGGPARCAPDLAAALLDGAGTRDRAIG
jgi:AcrR family transcriptional regulator